MNKKRYKKIKNKTFKKGGDEKFNKEVIKIKKICQDMIETINIIYSVKHLFIIDPELNKINDFLEEIIDIDNKKLDTNDKLYTRIIDLYNKYNLKLYHFNDNKKYKTSSLLFINVLNEEITLMKQMIFLANKINLNSKEVKITDKSVVNLKELETIKTRYINICNEFIEKNPCLEQFVTTIYPRVIKPLEEIIEKESNIDIIDKSLRNNNIKNKMSKTDFNNDGDFKKYHNPSYKLYQNILLTLLSFQKSLCGDIDNCKNNNSKIIQSYNANNYKKYLEYIEFFHNDKYKTKEIDWNKLKNIFEKEYMLELPNPEYFTGEKICCIDEIKDRQQQIIGGKSRFNII